MERKTKENASCILRYSRPLRALNKVFPEIMRG